MKNIFCYLFFYLNIVELYSIRLREVKIMDILSLITEQERAAAQLKAEAADKARDILSLAERETDAEIKRQAAEMRENRSRSVEQARKNAELESAAILADSAEKDAALLLRAEAALAPAAASIAKEAGRL